MVGSITTTHTSAERELIVGPRPGVIVADVLAANDSK